MLSVNQINVQIKLSELWKSTGIPNYPIKTEQVNRSDDVVNTRAVTNGQLKEALLTNSSQKTFLNDALHIWNKCPINIKQCESLYSAKRRLKHLSTHCQFKNINIYVDSYNSNSYTTCAHFSLRLESIVTKYLL